MEFPWLSQAPGTAGRKTRKIIGWQGTQPLFISWVRDLRTERLELVQDHTQPGNGIVGFGLRSPGYPDPHGGDGMGHSGGGGSRMGSPTLLHQGSSAEICFT